MALRDAVDRVSSAVDYSAEKAMYTVIVSKAPWKA